MLVTIESRSRRVIVRMHTALAALPSIDLQHKYANRANHHQFQCCLLLRVYVHSRGNTECATALERYVCGKCADTWRATAPLLSPHHSQNGQ